MKKLKIVIIGAGSAGFGRGAIADVLSERLLKQFDLTLSLVDIDEDALARMEKLAHMMAEHFDFPVKIEADPDRNIVLAGADYVIVSVARDRWKMWQKDYYIPASYGFGQTFGENGGPGGAFHTLRSLHLMVPMAKDIEKLAPGALVLNYTNPETRVCLAINKLTKVKAVGLCHGVGATRREIAHVLERDEEEIDLTIAGINHFHWALKIEEMGSGKDLKPEFDKRMKQSDWGLDPLTIEFYNLFGYLTYPAPSHPGEYVPFAHAKIGPVWTRWGIGNVSRRPSDTHESTTYFLEGKSGRASYELSSLNQAVKIQSVIEKGGPLADEMVAPTHELAVPIICDIEFDRQQKEDSVNVPNIDLAISNLAPDAMIEVPAIVGADGVKAVETGPLPEAIAGMCKLQNSIQNLIVEAYDKRSKYILMQALAIDPIVNNIDAAREMMEHMLRIEADYLPEME